MSEGYSIQKLLRQIGIRGYMPQLAGAMNRMLAAKSDLEYRQAKKELTRAMTDYDAVNVMEYDEYPKGSVFGTPLFMPVLLESFDTGIDDLLLEDAIVEISRAKNVVMTAVQGRDYTVKEYINAGDFSLKISGTLAGNGYSYPKEAMRKLHRYLAFNGSLKVVHELLNDLGIYEIVITDYALPKSPFINIQPYQISAVSEEPAELILE